MPRLVKRFAPPVAWEDEDVEDHLSYKLRRDRMEDEGGADTEVVVNAAAMGRSRLLAPSPAHLDSRSKKWPARLCSMLCCIVLLSFVAFLLAIMYIVFKDLSWEKENREIDIKTGILGLWSSLILALIAGLSCCSFSWTLTYFDSFEPGMFPPTPLSPARFRKLTGHSFHMGYNMAILNGITTALAIVWWFTWNQFYFSLLIYWKWILIFIQICKPFA